MTHFLSVMAIFKNETMSFDVWIRHYLWQGVEHFYLIDNGSTDNPLGILQSYIDRGLVTYRYMPERHQQVPLYHKMYTEADIRGRTKWLLVVDLDEYCFGVDRPLAQVLGDYDAYDVVISNWVMFGTDLEIQPPDIRTALTQRYPPLHILTKYMFQTARLRGPHDIHIHSLVGKRYRSITENHKIHLNHYPLQSLEYFTTVKMSRGDAHHAHHERTRNMDYFHSMNRDNHGAEDTLLATLVRDGYRT